MFWRTEKYFWIINENIFLYSYVKNVSYILKLLFRIGRETKLKENVIDLMELGSDDQFQHYLKEGKEEQDAIKQNQVILV